MLGQDSQTLYIYLWDHGECFTTLPELRDSDLLARELRIQEVRLLPTSATGV